MDHTLSIGSMWANAGVLGMPAITAWLPTLLQYTTLRGEESWRLCYKSQDLDAAPSSQSPLTYEG